VRGSYGSGKTFLTSLATSQALEERFVTTRVVLSVTDAPLFRLVEVYRRMCRNMALGGGRSGALQAILDRWLYGLEQQVIEVDGVSEDDDRFGAAVARRVRQALAPVGERAGRLASCIEAYHAAQFDQQYAESRGILDWMMGESKVAASLKRSAGVTGQLDNADVMIFVRGLLELLRAAGWHGLVVVFDETETTLRLKRPERQKSLEVLRQWIDAIDANEFPGLHLIVTGTPEFFDSPQGVPMLEPLNERIKVAFKDDGFDNLRQPQIRLRPFDRERLIAVARKVREIYPGNVADRMTDGLIERMASRRASAAGSKWFRAVSCVSSSTCSTSSISAATTMLQPTGTSPSTPRTSVPKRRRPCTTPVGRSRSDQRILAPGPADAGRHHPLPGTARASARPGARD
jgi:hypothetical protein